MSQRKYNLDQTVVGSEEWVNALIEDALEKFDTVATAKKKSEESTAPNNNNKEVIKCPICQNL